MPSNPHVGWLRLPTVTVIITYYLILKLIGYRPSKKERRRNWGTMDLLDHNIFMHRGFRQTVEVMTSLVVSGREVGPDEIVSRNKNTDAVVGRPAKDTSFTKSCPSLEFSIYGRLEEPDTKSIKGEVDGTEPFLAKKGRRRRKRRAHS